MKHLKKSLTAALTALALPASANFLTADLSNDAFKIEIGSDRLVQDVQLSAAATGTDDDVSVFSFTGMMAGPIQGQPNLTAGLGGRLYLSDIYDENVQGFALGGQAIYRLPQNPAVSFQGQFFYTPDILMSDDFDYQTDLSLRANYQLLPNGSVYVGYRHLKANTENGPNFTLDKGINIGFEFKF
ncbi:YfaZ family outer membrane protein [Catenovulum adriaticum]|uniref:YfaZ family protein n=1 Tax=Catenovulum adriaticum TaxID=2984846 RepID=A0ABY7AMZ1_9ALTE|nr:YfaZ family outer membrane protein [Catenovulum sp. TS8]WAJ70021.1 YfaZ family protein [Catenovulum sp. TS8]